MVQIRTLICLKNYCMHHKCRGLLVGAPVLGKLCGLRDTVIVMIGATSHCIARVVYALASQPVVFYFGGALGLLGPIATPVLRSMVSKLVPASERGKAFSLLSVADTSVPIFSSTIYSQPYNATIDFAPASIFWVTVFTQLLVFGCALTIHCVQGSRSLEQAVDPQEESKTEELVS